MQHTISINEIGAAGSVMAEQIEKCVHCGFCLPSCPTYRVLGEEMDSPRGRITLMKAALEGTLPVEQTMPFIDRCLGCVGCVTACPSGVQYGELLMPYRALAEKQRQRGFMDKVTRLMVRETLPFPGRFRAAAVAGRLAQPFRKLLPRQMQSMLALLPAQPLPAAQPLPRLVPAIGPRRARVALLAGCVQQALSPAINQATVRVLARNGVEVVIPGGQGCCGSLMAHNGDDEFARHLARRNLRAFADEAPKMPQRSVSTASFEQVDAIITNAAGCGSGMREYGLLFAGQPEEATARAFAGRVRDVSAFLDELGLITPPALPQPLRLAYHDACHLAHAQGITSAPRRLLSAIPNVTVLDIPDGEVCCGSAGTYNLEQPEIAAQLGRSKAENILATGAEAVAAGNIGCLVQVRTYLAQLGRPLPLWHTVEVLDQAYSQ